MSSLCGADCEKCAFKDNCKGCEETDASPFGGRCIAAQYIKTGGRECYNEFKNKLREEINSLLRSEGIGETDELFELSGEFVNLEYTLPGGEKVKFLDDKNIYLGCQLEFADLGVCYGVVADTSFILICSYSVNGSEPEIVIYKKR